MKPGKAIVIGASSGIGRELVRQLADQGWTIAAAARREDRLREVAAEFPDRVRTYAHDVLDTEAIPALFQKMCHDLGGLDLFVYSSGAMIEVGPSEFSFSKDLPMIEVNVTGAVAWLNEAATRFQSAQHGSIVGIGSVAGDRGRRGQPVYNASKAFLHAYLEALRNRLWRSGVTVVTIKPGPTDTEMTATNRMTRTMPVGVAVQRIMRVLDRQGEHYLSLPHRLIFAVVKRLPGAIFRRLKM